MPEGHTIHRAARDHAKALAGQRVSVSSPQGRFAPGAGLVDGTELRAVDAWGKHLFYRFAGERTVHVHLGLFGKWWRHCPPPPETHRQVRLRLAGHDAVFDLTGPTACDLLDPSAVDAIVARLGPDPIRTDADPDLAWAKLSRRRGPVGVAIMDQSLIAGVGNVFRAEALYVQRIHPQRPALTLERDEWDALWATLVTMLRRGVRSQRIVTVNGDDPGVVDGRTRYVYKQEHCARCSTPIRRWDLAGRWAYACERCQPPWPD
ncbi:MAG: Fpg/Nei family DNA glycosylase [Actinomycetota bacterium]|nr:Fpg/Nei family DNA glycosylase [Actinomycetota bacterium]